MRSTKRRGIEPGGIERLQDIVAGGGEKACLADIRLVGGGARLAEFAVDAGKLGRAFGDALLQRLICLFQRLVGADALGDVGEGGDDALVGHGVGAHLDDPLAAAEHQRERLVERQEMPHRLAEIAGRDIAALAERGDDIGQGKTDLAGIFRQVQQLPETPVPDRQPVGTVEDGNALVHLRKRRLQHVLVILQRLARLVEQPGGVGRGILDLLQDQ